MNSAHYPSLELCKKLNEIGFPKTELNHQEQDLKNGGWILTPCPSVMELLDVIPNGFMNGAGSRLKYNKDGFPNSLAEMVLWLHKEGHITFSK